MKYILYTISVLFIAMVVGCEGTTDPNNNNVSQDVIFPLAVNNEWVYQETIFDSNGVVSRQNNYSTAIVKDSIRLGEKVFIDQSGFIYVNRTDGLWYLNDGINRNEQLLAFKYPCKIGDTFPGSHFNYNGEKDLVTMTVVSLNESITVPAGTYTCIKYIGEGYFPSSGLKTDRRMYYLAPKIGIVLIEDYDYINHQANPYLAFRTELTRVTLK